MAKALVIRAGTTYRQLTVVGLSSKLSGGGGRLWECKCTCGKITHLPANFLVSGRARSCGCAKKEQMRELGRLKDHKIKPGTALRMMQKWYHNNAKVRGLCWELSEAEFALLTSSPCFYTGRKPTAQSVAPSGEVYLYNGIDRLDNSKGYTLENCVPCCTEVNFLKRDIPFEEFKALINEIHSTLEK